MNDETNPARTCRTHSQHRKPNLAGETLRAKRERHNCTAAGNAQRLMALARAHRIHFPSRAARLLPVIIRAEAAAARAQLLTLNAVEHAYEWGVMAERTITLENWAAACEYPSVQEATTEIFLTMMTKEPTT